MIYQEYVAAGLYAEKCGHKEEAAEKFLNAAAVADDLTLKAEALRLAGVNFRSCGVLDRSDQLLETALDLSRGVPKLYDAILRDLGMLRIAQGETDEALRLLYTSRNNQLARHDPQEAACTIGIIARAYWRQGKHSQARRAFARADQGLTEKLDWRLNNIIWWMKACGLGGRLFLAPRAIWLAFRSGFPRRAAEALIILVGGNRLYEFLRKVA